MIRPRIIPTLLLKDFGLVKTKQFKNPVYLGDPLNIINIFNKKMVDELILMDISCTINNSEIKYNLIRRISSVCFSPLTYGGGIKSISDADRIFNIGIEKICINSSAHKDPSLISEIAEKYGSQSVVICLNVRRNIFGKPEIVDNSINKIDLDVSLFEHMKILEKLGAGELIIYDVNREGTDKGFDVKLFKDLALKVSIPIIATGGAKDIEDIKQLFTETKVSGVGVGSYFVFYGSRKAVLISYPDRNTIRNLLN